MLLVFSYCHFIIFSPFLNSLPSFPLFLFSLSLLAPRSSLVSFAFAGRLVAVATLAGIREFNVESALTFRKRGLAEPATLLDEDLPTWEVPQRKVGEGEGEGSER